MDYEKSLVQAECQNRSRIDEDSAFALFRSLYDAMVFASPSDRKAAIEALIAVYRLDVL